MDNKQQKTKECEACGMTFTPHSSLQLYCKECGGHGLRIKQKYDREAERNKRYYQIHKPEINTYTCDICAKSFQTPYKNRRLCSNKCAKIASKQKLKCTNCNKQFIDIFELDAIPDSEIHKQRHFCSDACKQQFKQKNQTQKTKTEHICKNCNKIYYNKNQYFCCRTCRFEYDKKQYLQHQNKPITKYTCIICKQECDTPIFRCPTIKNSHNVPICSESCLTTYNKILKHKQKEDRDERLQKYIYENGMCSICDVSYKDCEYMQSNFLCIPHGAKCVDNKIQECPKFKTTFK